jgi:hypothetical protein
MLLGNEAATFGLIFSRNNCYKAATSFSSLIAISIVIPDQTIPEFTMEWCIVRLILPRNTA